MGRTVYCAGVFDILHKGHVEFLKRAKSLGTELIVGVLTDKGAKSYKGKLPIRSYEDRAYCVEELECVDEVVRQEQTDPTPNLVILAEDNTLVNILVRGTDVQCPVDGQKFVEDNRGTVVLLPYNTTISSSKIKERIKNGS